MRPSSRTDLSREAEVAAVVVAYRSSSTIGRCLDGLTASRTVGEVIVVDNSRDASTELLLRGRPNVRYEAPPVNGGFAAGCNLGVALTTAPWILLLNPDVVLHRSVDDLLDLVPSGTPAVLAGGLTDGQPGPQVLGNAKPDADWRTELRRATTGLRVGGVPATGDVHEVEQVDGAFMLLPRTTWGHLGGMDETFPLYYEDVDLCWRLRREGGVVLLWAVDYGVHAGGASSSQSRRAYLALRVSRTRWLQKRYGRAAGGLAGLLLAAVEVVTRSAGRCPETIPDRLGALRACWIELRRRMSVWPLEP